MKRNLPHPTAGTSWSFTTTDKARRGIERKSGTKAFTRVELVAIMAALGLLAVLALPALANTRARADRAACVNNLSRIGQGFNAWAANHGELYPIQVSAAGADGGTLSHASGLQNNIWFQFNWVSNELRTPKILVCPSDTIQRMASDWGFNSTNGFLHPNYQNRAVSYILSHPSLDLGRGVLSGDRNIRGSQLFGGCSTGIIPIHGIPLPAMNVLWGADLHSNTGNLLFSDGSVEQTDNAGLRNSLTTQVSEGPAFHFMAP